MVRWRRGTHGGQGKEEQAQEDKQESCRHTGTGLTPAIQGTTVSPTLSGEQMPVRPTSVACQCAPRPLYTEDRCWLACLRVSAGHARVRTAELPGDPSAESKLPPVVDDGDHFPHQRGSVVSVPLLTWHPTLMALSVPPLV